MLKLAITLMMETVSLPEAASVLLFELGLHILQILYILRVQSLPSELLQRTWLMSRHEWAG